MPAQAFLGFLSLFCIGGITEFFKCGVSQMFTTTVKANTKQITLEIASGHEYKGHEQSYSWKTK